MLYKFELLSQITENSTKIVFFVPSSGYDHCNYSPRAPKEPNYITGYNEPI